MHTFNLHDSFRTNFKYRDDKDRRYGKLNQDSAILYSDDRKTTLIQQNKTSKQKTVT